MKINTQSIRIKKVVHPLRRYVSMEHTEIYLCGKESSNFGGRGGAVQMIEVYIPPT